MKSQDIKVGKTYTNRGKGNTLRRVLHIGDEFRPEKYFSCFPPPEDEPGVEFEQGGEIRRLYLSSFASWAGREVANG